MFHMKSNDGTKIAVYVYNPHCEKTVVMVHGWPLSAKIYEYQLKMLLDCNIRVVTLDLSFVKVPTTIIHGQMDEVVSNDLAMIQHKAINGSKFFNLENSGHGIMYDELKQFNRIFLNEVKNINC